MEAGQQAGDRIIAGDLTTRGANLLDKAGEWDKSANIEAGVIVTDSNSWRGLVGEKLS